MTDDLDPDAVFAKLIAAVCVRNTFLEDLHSGTYPSSKTGDYSDVKVVSPYGEIAWNDLARLNNDEMKKLMKEVVDKLYTFLSNKNDPVFLENFMSWSIHFVHNWDEPKQDKNLKKMKRKQANLL